MRSEVEATGDEWERRKVVRVTSEGLDWADDSDAGAGTPLPFDAKLRARVIYASGHVAELESEPLDLPTHTYKTRSPAEAAGRVAIAVPAEPPAAPGPGAGADTEAGGVMLPEAQWRQLGSLQTTETIVQVQLRRLDKTSAFSKAPDQPQAVLLHCYALGSLFVSSKMRDGADADAGADKIVQQMQREMAAAKQDQDGQQQH